MGEVKMKDWGESREGNIYTFEPHPLALAMHSAGMKTSTELTANLK